MFLEPERTLARKLQEAVLTWRVEAALSKRQILERYLNIIELGDGVFGLRWVGCCGALIVGPNWVEQGLSQTAIIAKPFATSCSRTKRAITEHRNPFGLTGTVPQSLMAP